MTSRLRAGAGAVVLGAALLAVPAPAGAADPSGPDAAFLRAVAHDAAFEIRGAGVADHRSANTEVRALAALIASDHRRQAHELDALAADLGVTVRDRPDRTQRHLLALWRTASGAGFDCAYVPLTYAGHTADVMTFEAQAAHAGDARVRAFAARWLPVLQRHQDGAEAVLLDLDHC